jgi:hypothetical protein
MIMTRRSTLLVAALLAALAGSVAFWLLRGSVREALDAPLATGRPLQFVAVVDERRLEAWGDATVRAAAVTTSGLVTAGGSGVREAGGRDLSAGLPTLRVAALVAWRGESTVALEAGGLFRRRAGHWEEMRSGWGALHVRALHETPAGELLVGAREGLFRAAWGATTLERLDTHPVRAVAVGAGFLVAGGEDGLFRVETGRITRVETPDSWIEAAGLLDGELIVATAAGLVRGRPGGPLDPVPGAHDVAFGEVHDGSFWGVSARPLDAVLRYQPGRRLGEERLPSIVRNVMTAGGDLLADTDDGLFRRDGTGWRRLGSRPAPSLPPGRSHVGALAWLSGRLVAGFFDGGLATADVASWRAARALAPDLTWRAVPGSDAWGVNALLPAGGVLYVASLRGAARFDGQRLMPINGPGAAFSLAATHDGVAIGYGQGVLLPGSTLLSAFHGLPGNQAVALAAGESLFVGTPSGLGAMDGRRVRWRVTSADGRLPHPWVTALAVAEDGLYVGTYGGGVTRRAKPNGITRPFTDPAHYQPFEETADLKVNPGCLVEAGGRVYAGTDGRGLWELSEDRARFEPLRLPLPSPRVTALVAGDDALWIGTDEGIARLPLNEGKP